MFGKLAFKSYDKLDDKFRYNQMSEMEYQELLGRNAIIGAKLVNEGILSGP